MSVDDAGNVGHAARLVGVRLKVTKPDDDSALNQYFECEHVNSTEVHRTKC